MEELTIPVYPRQAMVGILVMAITRFHQTIRHLSDPIVIAKLDILAQNVFKRQWICNMSGYIQRTIKQHIIRLRVVTVPFFLAYRYANFKIHVNSFHMHIILQYNLQVIFNVRTLYCFS